MIEIPAEFSPIGPQPQHNSLAAGPFVVEMTDGDGRFVYMGYHILRADPEEFSWLGAGVDHLVQPGETLRVTRQGIEFAEGDRSYLLRPIELGDGLIVGLEDNAFSPDGPVQDMQLVKALAETVYNREFGDSPTIEMGEENLYISQDADGEPVALLKMSASHPTLVREDSRWRRMKPDEDDLFGDRDTPARDTAVAAWDSGNLQDVERLLMDSRFSPKDVLNVWFEVGDTDKLERLLIERSRGRFYERTLDARWEPAEPNDDATTLDVMWGAISAWDSGDLRRIAQAEPYDANGDAA